MEEKLFEIEADIVTIEVRDRNTGEVSAFDRRSP